MLKVRKDLKKLREKKEILVLLIVINSSYLDVLFRNLLPSLKVST